MNLTVKALLRFLVGVAITFLLVFVPAGTVKYFGGWLLMGVLFIPMLFVGIALAFKNPSLLEKRLRSKEETKEQKTIVKTSAAIFILGFISAGISFRFDFLVLPKNVSLIASALFLVSYLFYAEVLRENRYISRVVETSENQKVVDTGLYAVIRHPMYCATVFMFLSVPLILGSVISLLIFLFYLPLIAKRIKYEEQFLEKELSGYSEYKQKVKYRLIPFVW